MPDDHTPPASPLLMDSQ